MTSVSPELDLDQLQAFKVVGKGAMGVVFLVYDPVSDPSAYRTFAVKAVDKSALPRLLDGERRARWELSVLIRLSVPVRSYFLPRLIGAVDSDDLIAWATPYCPGGDLNSLRYRQNERMFSSAVIRFYAAEIICAIEGLHSMSIVYRDLKPENVLIQKSGHVTLTDFDLSRALTPRTVKALLEDEPVRTEPRESCLEMSRSHGLNILRLLRRKVAVGVNTPRCARVSPVTRRGPGFVSSERSNSFVGTEEYVAPEVVRGEGHEFSVDWWALGVMMYEMLYGSTPFKGKSSKETFRNIVVKPPEFIGQPTSLTDLISLLLDKDPTKRLGYQHGAVEIKEHEFFRHLRWDLLTDIMRPPYIPEAENEQILTSECFNIRKYFDGLQTPASFHPSPSSPSSSSGCRSFAGF